MGDEAPQLLIAGDAEFVGVAREGVERDHDIPREETLGPPASR